MAILHLPKNASTWKKSITAFCSGDTITQNTPIMRHSIKIVVLTQKIVHHWWTIFVCWYVCGVGKKRDRALNQKSGRRICHSA